MRYVDEREPTAATRAITAGRALAERLCPALWAALVGESDGLAAPTGEHGHPRREFLQPYLVEPHGALSFEEPSPCSREPTRLAFGPGMGAIATASTPGPP